MSTSNIAEEQARAIMQKAERWRGYMSKLAEELPHGPLEYWIFRQSSLWATTFAYVEWLVVFERRAARPTATNTAEVLNRYWGWEPEVGKLFVRCGRNPIAHVGQANSFYSYAEYNGDPANVGLDVNSWSDTVTADWDKHHSHKAVWILPPHDDDMGQGKVRDIVFFHQMLLSDLLPVLAEQVAKGIATETDEEKLETIMELNRQIPH